jgi:hypothetical protein
MLFLRPFGCHKTNVFWGKNHQMVKKEILRMAKSVCLLGVSVAKFPKKN